MGTENFTGKSNDLGDLPRLAKEAEQAQKNKLEGNSLEQKNEDVEDQIDSAISDIEKVSKEADAKDKSEALSGASDEKEKIKKNLEKKKLALNDYARKKYGFRPADKIYVYNGRTHVVVEAVDGTKSHWVGDGSGDFTMKKIVEGKTTTNFGKDGMVTQQKEGKNIKTGSQVEQEVNMVSQYSSEVVAEKIATSKKENIETGVALVESDDERFKRLDQLFKARTPFPELDDIDFYSKQKDENLKKDLAKNNAKVTGTPEASDAIPLVSSEASKLPKDADSNADDLLKGYTSVANTSPESEPKNTDDAEGETKEALEKKTINKDADISEAQSILKSIAKMEKDPFATSSMIMREKRKIREMVKDGKVDSLEAELLMQDAKKTKVEGKLGIFASRIAEKNRQFKKDSWMYRNLVSVPEYDKKWKTWAHRIGKTAIIGAGFGAAGMGAAAALGVGAIGGAGIAATRLLGSTFAGGIAGKIHESVTKKSVAEDQARYKDMLDSGYAETRKVLGKEDVRLSGEEFTALRKLRKQESLSESEKAVRDSLEAKYAEYERVRNSQFDRSRDNYKELYTRRKGKNEKNRALVTGATAFLVGFGSSYAMPYLNPDIIPGPEVIPGGSVVNPDDVTPGPEVTPVSPENLTSGRIPVETGDGYTHMLQKAFAKNPDVFKSFNVGNNMSGSEAFSIAKQIGIVDANGNIGTEFRLFDTNGSIEFVQEDGGLTLQEYNASGEYLGCFNENGGHFDAEGRKSTINYLEDTSRVAAPETFVIQESAPQVEYAQETFVIQESNPVIEQVPAETFVIQESAPVASAPAVETGPTAAELAAEQQRLAYEQQKIAYEKHIAELEEKARNVKKPKRGLWAAAGVLLGVGIGDVLEDGKLDGYGIFGGNKGGTPPIVTGPTPPVVPTDNPGGPGYDPGSQPGNGNDGGYNGGGNTGGGPNTPGNSSGFASQLNNRRN